MSADDEVVRTEIDRTPTNTNRLPRAAAAVNIDSASGVEWPEASSIEGGTQP